MPRGVSVFGGGWGQRIPGRRCVAMVPGMMIMRAMILRGGRQGGEACQCKQGNGKRQRTHHPFDFSFSGRTVTTCIIPACM